MAEFLRGLPQSVIENRPSELDQLQEVYGKFSASVLQRVTYIDPSAPLDILAYGDNWMQLVNTYTQPRDQRELAISRMGIPGTFFCDTWQIMPRNPDEDLLMTFSQLVTGVRAGSLDSRIIMKLAVLNLADHSPIIERSDLSYVKDTPWGFNGYLRGTVNTQIYAIQKTFAQLTITPPERCGDDHSVVRFKEPPNYQVSED